MADKDIKYKVFAARISDEVIEELRKRRNDYRSWNLMFKDLLDIKTPFRMKQKRK